MLVTEDKVLIHFNTNDFCLYILKGNDLTMQYKKTIAFGTCFVDEILLKEIYQFLDGLREIIGDVNNERIRLYATGIFQKFAPLVQTQLIIEIFVRYGLYFNIVQPELEHFYLQNNQSTDSPPNIIRGLVHQEFRRVVICGSFQQHLKNIGEVIKILHNHNIEVLSPWTTEIRPETVGTNFLLLKGQAPLRNERDAWKHKYVHMHKFIDSDAIIVCNPDGLIGAGTMFEFGFMVANSKRIIFTERPKDLSILFPYEVGLNF